MDTKKVEEFNPNPTFDEVTVLLRQENEELRFQLALAGITNEKLRAEVERLTQALIVQQTDE